MTDTTRRRFLAGCAATLALTSPGYTEPRITPEWDFERPPHDGGGLMGDRGP